VWTADTQHTRWIIGTRRLVQRLTSTSRSNNGDKYLSRVLKCIARSNAWFNSAPWQCLKLTMNFLLWGQTVRWSSTGVIVHRALWAVAHPFHNFSVKWLLSQKSGHFLPTTVASLLTTGHGKSCKWWESWRCRKMLACFVCSWGKSDPNV